MLRRPPTALSISADDLASYDLRHQAHLAAHARALAQQREQEPSENTSLEAQHSHQRPHQQRQRLQQVTEPAPAAAGAPARVRRSRAPGAIQTGSPSAPLDDDDDNDNDYDVANNDMGTDALLVPGHPAHARSFPGSMATDRRPQRRTGDVSSSWSGEDDNIDDRGAAHDIDVQTERVPLPHDANAGDAGSPADLHASRNNRGVRADAERRRLLERERIMGRGNNDGGGGGSSSMRRQQQGGSGLVGERAPRR